MTISGCKSAELLFSHYSCLALFYFPPLGCILPLNHSMCFDMYSKAHLFLLQSSLCPSQTRAPCDTKSRGDKGSCPQLQISCLILRWWCWIGEADSYKKGGNASMKLYAHPFLSYVQTCQNEYTNYNISCSNRMHP